LKIYKTKTQKFNGDKYGSWYFCDRSSLLHKKGLKRKSKQPLQFFTRDIARHKYEQLPNGRYYEYSLTAISYFKGKPCKYYYVLDENKSKVFVGFELFENILPNFINTDELYFDVKGGKLNYLKKPKKKSEKSHKQHINKAIDSAPTAHRDAFAEKYIQMVLGHKKMGHISHEVYCHAMLILRKCAGLNLIIPHKFKELLYNTYAQDSKVSKSTAEAQFISYALKASKRTGKESIYK
jgi:hypothetical protein